MTNTVKSEVKRIASMLNPKDIDRSISVLEGVCDLVEKESECVGCAAVKPAPQPRIRTRTIAWAALLVGLFLPPLIPLDEIIGTATAFRGPAVGFHKMEIVTPTVHMGQPLIIKTSFQYLKACTWRWVLEWKSAEGKPIAMIWHWGSAHVIGVAGEHSMPFELPIGMTPGNYIFRESATGECGHGDIAQIAPEEVAFTVTD